MSGAPPWNAHETAHLINSLLPERAPPLGFFRGVKSLLALGALFLVLEDAFFIAIASPLVVVNAAARDL
jgi:hypothetical protein